MPNVTIDGRTVEVPAGTNLIEAAKKVGVQVPHYCYHPRLTVVGQCRMCLVKIEGMPKLQAGCTTQVMRDGMVVKVDDPEVKEAQQGIMEFLLINHPLDCPICDQAGECGLQDYSFKHGQAFSRFRYEEKRTYPGRERIPLGPSVVLNMNRCIQCTRCVRFTEEISETGELGFFQRGSRAEIGTFPGKVLDNDLSTCVVDICPVGALTSTRFRFAERVWYLDKKPSICTGCDAGCNVTLEHRRGAIRRYKPRVNPEVNDHWMCDYGRTTFERFGRGERLSAPRMRSKGGDALPTNWSDALDAIARQLRRPDREGAVAFLASGHLTTEEAFLVATLADRVGTPHRAVWVEEGPERRIPNPSGGVTGRETAPNRRGIELAGLVPGDGAITAADLLEGDGAARCAVLVVAENDLGEAGRSPEVAERLRRAGFLVVVGWQDGPLAEIADVALPTATHAERSGTYVNSQGRIQRFERAFPARGDVRDGVSLFSDLLGRFEPEWSGAGDAAVFERMASAVPALGGLSFRSIPAFGSALDQQAEGAGVAEPAAGGDGQ